MRALTTIDGPGAILSSGAGELDPVALVAGLWRSALARGASLYAPVDVVDVHAGRSSVTLNTGDGVEVRARYVVFATGYEHVDLVHPKGHKVMSTWAMATAPQPDRLWPSRCLIWQAADPYLYLRTTGEGRIIVGGEDEGFSDERKRDALIASKIVAIRRKLGGLLPNVDTRPEFSWAACFGASDTGLPSIGAVPGANRCFAVLGYGGNGITFSTVAAQLIQRAGGWPARPGRGSLRLPGLTSQASSTVELVLQIASSRWLRFVGKHQADLATDLNAGDLDLGQVFDALQTQVRQHLGVAHRRPRRR